MDPQIAWLRGWILRGVILRLGAAGVLVLMGVGFGTLVGGWVPIRWALPLGWIAAILACGSWVGISLLTNPVDLRYMRSYLAQPVLVSNAESRPELGSLPAAEGDEAQHCYTVVDESGGDQPLYDVFSMGQVVGCSWRGSEAAVFYSRLVDGRTVCTDRQLTVPRPGWVLNLVRSDDLTQCLQSHWELLDHLESIGIPVEPAPDPWLVVDHLRDERNGYAQLGPLLSCFLDVDGDRSPWRLTVSVPPAELLALEGVGPIAEGPPPRRLRVVSPAEPEAEAV